MTLTNAHRFALSRAADEESRTFPRHMIELPAEKVAGSNRTVGAKALNAWRSRTHLAQLHDDAGTLRLSVHRVTDVAWHIRFDAAGGISWDDLQRIKGECGFGDRWAVEVYPPDDRVVNVAPIRHLWLLDEQPPYAWSTNR